MIGYLQYKLSQILHEMTKGKTKRVKNWIPQRFYVDILNMPLPPYFIAYSTFIGMNLWNVLNECLCQQIQC